MYLIGALLVAWFLLAVVVALAVGRSFARRDRAARADAWSEAPTNAA